MDRRTSLLLAVGALVVTLAFSASAWAAPLPVKPTGVSPQSFQPAESCPCHGDLVTEWSQSMHAKALDDKLYRTKVDEANAATDGQLGQFCDACHGPAATMTGEIASGAELSPGTGQAVVCSFCHQVTGQAEGDVGNTSQLVDPSGVRRAQIEQPQAPHPAEYSEFHTKAEICGGCHNVNHPVNGMHLEATYTEWSQSDYAKQGIVCQDCHMSAGAGVRGPSKGQAAPGAPQRENIYHMSFVGGQVALGNSEAAAAMLKSAAAIEIDMPEVVGPGEKAEAIVEVMNKGAGHYLPTGLTEVRQMWLEISLNDAAGTTQKLAERRFETILQDDEGNAPVELWEATSIKSDDRIPPKGSVTETVTVSLPQGAETGTLVATLYYQSVPDEFAKKAGVENPTTTMASTAVDIYSSQEAKDAASAPSDSGAGPNAALYGVITALAVAMVVGGFLFWRSKQSE